MLKQKKLFQALFLKIIFRLLQIKDKSILDILFKDNTFFHNFLHNLQSIKLICSQISQIQILIFLKLYNISCTVLD